jgi:glycosyltransferase involved in cell wall biosynthesis
LNILFINYTDITQIGGINSTIKRVSEELVKKGHDCSVLSPNTEGLPAREEINGVNILRVKSPLSKYFYGLSWSAARFLQKNLGKSLKPDIIHIHGYHTLFSPEMAFIVKIFSKKSPIVFSFHLDIFRSTFAGKYFWWLHNQLVGKNLSRVTDHIVSFSIYETEKIKRMFNIQDSKFSIIPHGVDIIETGLTSKLASPINLVFAGHLIKRKGVQYILFGLSELIHLVGNDQVKLTIIGEGPEKEYLQQLAVDLKLTSNIVWLPFAPKSELNNLIKQANILLLLSESEAFGIIVAEALALGTYTLVTKRTALQEFLNEPGCFGLEYPPDPHEFANLVLEICQHKVQIGPFSKKIRTWDKVAGEYENVYEKFL